MELSQVAQLARRLELAGVLTNAELSRLRIDIEHYAASDLYGAARLCKDYLPSKISVRLPVAVMAAERIARHFEARIHKRRRSISLYGEIDMQIRQPNEGSVHTGPIVGTTPNCLVQRDDESRDLIIHSRHAVRPFGPAISGLSVVSIRYPLDGVGGVGLLSASPAHGRPRTPSKAAPLNAAQQHADI